MLGPRGHIVVALTIRTRTIVEEIARHTIDADLLPALVQLTLLYEQIEPTPQAMAYAFKLFELKAHAAAARPYVVL